MIRTGQQYLDSIRDTREVYINGERVRDVTQNPMMKPLIDIRARIYDMLLIGDPRAARLSRAW
jgi:4-hydroxyphenylacetate 3-monooxygenase